MVKYIVLAVGWLFIGGLARAELPIREDDYRLLVKHAAGGALAARELREGIKEKARVMEYLQSLTKPLIFGGTALFPGFKYYLLANLGDARSAMGFYNGFIKSPMEVRELSDVRNMNAISHPVFIAALGPALDKNAPRVVPRSGNWHLQVPYVNARHVLRVVAESGFFHHDVAAWARARMASEFSSHAKLSECLDAAREFWAVNASHIESGRYDQVRVPGSAGSEVAPSNRPRSSQMGSAAPAVEPSPDKNLIVQTGTQAGTIWQYWPSGAGAIVLMVLVGLRLWLRKRESSPTGNR